MATNLATVGAEAGGDGVRLQADSDVVATTPAISSDRRLRCELWSGGDTVTKQVLHLVSEGGGRSARWLVAKQRRRALLLQAPSRTLASGRSVRKAWTVAVGDGEDMTRRRLGDPHLRSGLLRKIWPDGLALVRACNLKQSWPEVMIVSSLLTVAVGVLTYRRPEFLVKLLPQLEAQLASLPEGVAGKVLVVDNDPACSAAATVRGFGSNVHYVSEPTPGIAAARQRCLASAADFDLLQFIDDDEEPVGDWLTQMIGAWQEFGRPAAVAGRVLARFAEPPPAWVEAGAFFVRRTYMNGTELQAAPSGNLLLDIAQVTRLGVQFDATLGLRGGEDTQFTRQLADRGGRIVFCDKAAIIDLVPVDRMTKEWVLRRAWFHGGTAAHLQLRELSGFPLAFSRLRLLMGGLGRGAVGVSRAMVGVISRNQGLNARGWRLAYRGAGMAAEAAGWSDSEYKRVST